MKKILIYMLVVATITSIFLYINNNQKQKLIKLQKQEEEILIKTLERFYLAGKVECFNQFECSIENGVSKYFRFSNLYLRNRSDFVTFVKLLDIFTKDFRTKFIKKNHFEYYLNSDNFFTNNIQEIDNLNKEFEIGITKLEVKNFILKDLAFLSWYIDNNTYETIINIFKNINIYSKVKYNMINQEIDFNKIDGLFIIKLLDTCKISLIIKDERVFLHIENYDILKPILIEFKEIIKTFLAKNQEIIFFTSLLMYYDEIISNEVQSITLSTNQHFDIKNILFTKSLKTN